YPIRLSHGYWKATGDTAPFDDQWLAAMQTVINTFTAQQRLHGKGPYTFQRNTAFATDTIPMGGYGYPVKPNGLICSMFRPSDDATIYAYLIPSNFFALESLLQLQEMGKAIPAASALVAPAAALAAQVKKALDQHATVQHGTLGNIYAFEVNGFGSANLMDDANIPSLLSMPYLNAVKVDDPVYQRTRRFVLSADNPFFFKGSAAEGIGGPHVGLDMIWPMSIVMRGLTSRDDQEIKWCLDTLQKTHAQTGFIHESFHKDDPAKFTRKWFAWSNTIFGEFIWKVYRERPHLLKA
ncbi:MAG TPA: glycoside hydrolase family 125 protein, partial [Chitinophaga sp.]